MKSRISFSWDLHYACNYRCQYCWWHGKWQDLLKLNRYLSVEEWEKRWRTIFEQYGSVGIAVSGGEPLLYPRIKELIAALSKIHTLDIATNLSTDIKDFVSCLDPAKVHIRPTFHPALSDFGTFLERTALLKKKGFTDSVYYLAYPPQIKLIDFYRNRFAQENIPLRVMAFWGLYDGVVYPSGYTEEERVLIDDSLAEQPGEVMQLVANEDVNGKVCNAGRYYAVIRSDGTVLRCNGSGLNEAIGNFFDDGFKLSSQPLTCNAQCCRSNGWEFLLEEKEIPVEVPLQTSSAPLEGSAALRGAAINFRPKLPPRNPPYRVFWNWDIVYACNYKCSYCDVANGKFPCKKGQEKHSHATLAEWLRIWDRIFENYYSCVVRLSGGEPTRHPLFYSLIPRLQERHLVDITTNLSFDPSYFIKKIKPDNIVINASFHPEFVEFKDFLERTISLSAKGYPISVCIVSYPPFIHKIAKYKETFEKKGILFKISPFDGKFKGQMYPAAFTEKEKKILAELSGQTFKIPLNAAWYEWKTEKKKEMKGQLCRMGQMYAKIFPNGDVTRCCAPGSGALGNIFAKDFRLLEEPQPCEFELKCPCFKAMFVGQEKKWLPLWEVAEHKVFTRNKMMHSGGRRYQKASRSSRSLQKKENT